MNRMNVVAVAGLLVAVPWIVASGAPRTDRHSAPRIVPAVADGAPVAERLSVESAQVGHVVMIVGRNLAGRNLDIRFGLAPAPAENPGRSRQLIKVEVPGKIDPRAHDTVTVTVFVDGREAEYPNGPLRFTYQIPQPGPEIESFATDDPDHPHTVQVGQRFTITFTGSHFLTGRRAPWSCLAIGQFTSMATGLSGPASDTEVAFQFDGLVNPGDYHFLIAFSDASAAGIDAPGFVETPIFGHPPEITAVEATIARESLACDYTRMVVLGLCALTGLNDLQPLPPGVILEGTYTTLDLSARVIDLDSTPTQNDILLVAASYLDSGQVGPPAEVSLVMLDDGAANRYPMPQSETTWLEDCSSATPGACACQPATYPLASGDVVARDDLFTRSLALVNPTTDLLFRDCIVAQTQRTPLMLPASLTLEWKIEAVDREGNLATWPSRPSVTAEADTLSCSGDPCGCCLLLSTNPAAPPPEGCQGLQGMPSSTLPGGLCMSF